MFLPGWMLFSGLCLCKEMTIIIILVSPLIVWMFTLSSILWFSYLFPLSMFIVRRRGSGWFLSIVHPPLCLGVWPVRLRRYIIYPFLSGLLFFNPKIFPNKYLYREKLLSKCHPSLKIDGKNVALRIRNRRLIVTRHPRVSFPAMTTGVSSSVGGVAMRAWGEAPPLPIQEKKRKREQRSK